MAKLDRGTSSLTDQREILNLSDRQGCTFIALDLGIDTTTPIGWAMAQMAGVTSGLERKLIGQRTSDALQVLKTLGSAFSSPGRPG